jgi:ribosome-binding protein aMBF1 (putative translation factor)
MQQHHSTCTRVSPRASTSPYGRRFSASALRTLRERAGLDRRQLADRIGRSAQSIRLYELDEVQPPVEIIDRLSLVLGVGLSELLESRCDRCLTFTMAERATLDTCRQDARCPMAGAESV